MQCMTNMEFTIAVALSVFIGVGTAAIAALYTRLKSK